MDAIISLLKADANAANAFGALASAAAAFLGLFLSSVSIWISVSSARSQRLHNELSVRAYVSSSPDFIFDFSPTHPAEMRYTIKNHGTSPAYSMRNVAVVDILPYPIPENFKFPALPKIMSAPMTLHHGDHIFCNVVAQKTFTAQEISDAVTNNGWRIYCFGVVEYKSFGNTHTTHFCRSIIGCPNLQSIGSGTTTTKLDLVYEVSNHHNEAD